MMDSQNNFFCLFGMISIRKRSSIYISSIRIAGIKKEFSVSQRQAIIKLIKKG